jgi:cytidylate kinase
MSLTSYPVIAIDGTAASGKSTLARELARRLDYVYVNTGAMYRGVTWYLQEKGVPLMDPDSVGRSLPPLPVEMKLEQGEFLFLIGGIDPLPHVRQGRVNDAVSVVAQVAGVRRLLVAEQQKLASRAPLVMEGRDIGTVVFPETPYKFFIDADSAVRAERRSRQGEADVVHQRDALDSRRANSPLTCAPDALRLDSGLASVDELIAAALRHLAAKGLANAPALP